MAVVASSSNWAEVMRSSVSGSSLVVVLRSANVTEFPVAFRVREGLRMEVEEVGRGGDFFGDLGGVPLGGGGGGGRGGGMGSCDDILNC